VTARRFVGRIGAVRTVDLSFQVGGEVAAVPVLEGQLVPRGTTLGMLDPADLRIALREAEARHELAERTLRRNRSLPAGAVARSVVDETETELRLRAAELDRARRHLAHATVAAPFDALVTRRLVEANAVFAAGTAFLRVQDVTEFRVTVSLPEELIARHGDPAALRAEASLPGRPGPALPLAFREIRTEPNAVAQTYEVTFGMTRPPGVTILPGMTTSVTLRLDGDAGALLDVPLAAVVGDPAAGAHVWVHEPGTGTVRRQRVELGEAANGRVAVRAGLETGQAVAVAGLTTLREGVPVRPVAGP
jgi:RND family efflux transporter MFP subunit